MKNPFGEESQRRRKDSVSVCTDSMYVYKESVCVCGESEENESTGPSFIHSPLKQYYRSITHQIRE